MLEAFAEAFVAVTFIHASFRGSFHGSYFVEASVEEN